VWSHDQSFLGTVKKPYHSLTHFGQWYVCNASFATTTKCWGRNCFRVLKLKLYMQNQNKFSCLSTLFTVLWVSANPSVCQGFACGPRWGCCPKCRDSVTWCMIDLSNFPRAFQPLFSVLSLDRYMIFVSLQFLSYSHPNH